jgi:hypothetical protein
MRRSARETRSGAMMTIVIGFTDNFLVTLTHNSSMISIPRYRMRRSACGTGSGGASCSPPCSPSMGFTDNLTCNSDSPFFCVFYYQIPDEEERLRDRKWWCFLLSSMLTFAMGFNDNLTCNSSSQFFYVFYSQIPDEEECLRDRKWWCFLLSSMLTFAMGVTGVLVIRLLKFVFCREVASFFPQRRRIEKTPRSCPFVGI